MCPLSLETFSVWRTDLGHYLYCKGSINSHHMQLWATNLSRFFLYIFSQLFMIVASIGCSTVVQDVSWRCPVNTVGKAQPCAHNGRIFKIDSGFNWLHCLVSPLPEKDSSLWAISPLGYSLHDSKIVHMLVFLGKKCVLFCYTRKFFLIVKYTLKKWTSFMHKKCLFALCRMCFTELLSSAWSI